MASNFAENHGNRASRRLPLRSLRKTVPMRYKLYPVHKFINFSFDSLSSNHLSCKVSSRNVNRPLSSFAIHEVCLKRNETGYMSFNEKIYMLFVKILTVQTNNRNFTVKLKACLIAWLLSCEKLLPRRLLYRDISGIKIHTQRSESVLVNSW